LNFTILHVAANVLRTPFFFFAFCIVKTSLYLFRPRRNVSSALYEGRDLERGGCDGLSSGSASSTRFSAISASPEISIPADTPGQGEGEVRVAYAFAYPFPPLLVRGRC
jgi:hypothetical protein